MGVVYRDQTRPYKICVTKVSYFSKLTKVNNIEIKCNNKHKLKSKTIEDPKQFVPGEQLDEQLFR